jgi:hypothetical protein
MANGAGDIASAAGQRSHWWQCTGHFRSRSTMKAACSGVISPRRNIQARNIADFANNKVRRQQWRAFAQAASVASNCASVTNHLRAMLAPTMSVTLCRRPGKAVFRCQSATWNTGSCCGRSIPGRCAPRAETRQFMLRAGLSSSPLRRSEASRCWSRFRTSTCVTLANPCPLSRMNACAPPLVHPLGSSPSAQPLRDIQRAADQVLARLGRAECGMRRQRHVLHPRQRMIRR